MEPASKTIPFLGSSQSQSKVIVFAVDVITQRDLIEYRVLAKKLSEGRAALRDARQEIFHRLRAGARVEPGLKTARIVSIRRRRKTFHRLSVEW